MGALAACMARACRVSLLFLLLARQDVDVLGVHGDLRGAVVEGIDLLYALLERCDVGRLCLMELLEEFFGLPVVEPAYVPSPAPSSASSMSVWSPTGVFAMA